VNFQLASEIAAEIDPKQEMASHDTWAMMIEYLNDKGFIVIKERNIIIGLKE